jgi:hypothetical protein
MDQSKSNPFLSCYGELSLRRGDKLKIKCNMMERCTSSGSLKYDMTFPQNSGHTEKVDIRSNLEVGNWRRKRS